MNNSDPVPDELPESPENALIMKIKVTPIDVRENADDEESEQ